MFSMRTIQKRNDSRRVNERDWHCRTVLFVEENLINLIVNASSHHFHPHAAARHHRSATYASTRQQSSNAFTRSQCGRGSRVAHNELITFCVISIPLISNASAETEAAGSLCRLRHDDTSGDSGVYCKCSRCGNWHNELALSDYTFNKWNDIVGNGLKAKLLHDNDNISLSTAVQLLVLDW